MLGGDTSAVGPGLPPEDDDFFKVCVCFQFLFFCFPQEVLSVFVFLFPPRRAFSFCCVLLCVLENKNVPCIPGQTDVCFVCFGSEMTCLCWAIIL